MKNYAIEKRLRNQDCSEFYKMCHFHEWHLWRKYETEKQRDEALKALANREMWEYRKKDLK